MKRRKEVKCTITKILTKDPQSDRQDNALLISKKRLTRARSIRLISQLDVKVSTVNNKTLKKAAVLIPLVKRQNGLNIILTERALHLRHHPGQISFPGGKYEQNDHSLEHTALRETQEEIDMSY